MTPTMSIDNYLSFDILGHVFSHYVQNETILEPLETLLLVCKSWHNAAVGHHALWGQLRIYLGYNKTHKIWGTRLPLRLARSGNAPLLIELDIYISSHYTWEDEKSGSKYNSIFSKRVCCKNRSYIFRLCPCAAQAESVAQDLLVLLAGHNGKNCTRWIKLVLHLKTGDRPLGLAAVKALSYPTPRLSFLWLVNVHIDKYFENCAILPSAPSLIRAILRDSVLPTWPDLSNADHINLRWEKMDDANPGKFDASSVIQVSNASFLALDLPQGLNVQLPLAMPKLYTLDMGQQEAPLPPDLYKTFMPNLRKMLFYIHSGPRLSQLLTLQGASLSQLTSLFLRWKPMGRSDLLKVRDSLRRVLQACTSLEYLSGDMATLCVSLKLLWDDRQSIEEAYEDRSIVLRGNWTHTVFPLSFNPSKMNICVAASVFGFPSLESSWDSISFYVINHCFDYGLSEWEESEEGKNSEWEDDWMTE